MAIYKLENGNYVCSSRGTWLSGVYDSENSCRMAFKTNPFTLDKIWNEVLYKGTGVITIENLRNIHNEYKNF